MMMINRLNRLVSFHGLNIRNCCCSFSQYKIQEIKNSSILIVQDQNNKLPYIAQVNSKEHGKGVVIKIQQSNTAYVAMYQQVKGNPKNLQISSISKSWKQSTKQITSKISEISQLSENPIFDVNTNRVLSQQQKQQPSKPSLQRKSNQGTTLKKWQKSRLLSNSIILNACYDLYQGDMISFLGCQGSKKTQTALSIVDQFNVGSHLNDPICIYANPYHNEVQKAAKNGSRFIGFSSAPGRQPTDAGVYFLALKAIQTSIQLKKQGKNVLLIVDRLQDILMRQWSLLQSIKFNSKVIDSSQMFQYNSLKIPPISILNQIYSNCGSGSTVQRNKGCMSSILISQKTSDELVQEISNFSNNIKHLETLSKVINFPLNLKANSNIISSSSITQTQQTSDNDIYQFIRQQINNVMKQKKQTELKRSLYKNEIKDAPWDYYLLLDAEWWIRDVKQARFNTPQQACSFLRWVRWNIQSDFLGRWTLTAKESFIKYQAFCKLQQQQVGQSNENTNHQLPFNEQILEQFLQQAKMQNWFNPFKKDYLN